MLIASRYLVHLPHRHHQRREKEDIVHGSVVKKPQKPGTATPLKAVQKVIHKSTGPEVLPSRRPSVGNPKNARPPLSTNLAKQSTATINRVPVQAGVSRLLSKVYKSVDTPKCAGAVRSSAQTGLSRLPVKFQQEFVHSQKHDRPVKKQTQMIRPFQHSGDSSMRFESLQTPQIKQCFSLRRSLTHTENIQKSRRHTCTPKSGQARLTDAQQDRLNKLNDWQARNRRLYKRPPIEKRSHDLGCCDTRAKGLGEPVGSFLSGEDEEVFCQRIDRLLARYEELIEQDEDVDLVLACRELPMLEKFPRFGLLLARQAEKQSRAALAPPLNGHEQARQRESQPASELSQDHAADLCASNAGSIDDVGPNHGNGGLCEHIQAEATSPNCQRKMYFQVQDIRGSSPKNQPQLQSAAAANSDSQTPALGSTMKLLLSDKKPLPGFLPSDSAKHVRFLTPVRRSIRLSLNELRHTAICESRPCLTSLREVLLGKDEVQRVDENEKAPTAFIFRGNELAGSPPGLWEAVDDGLVVLRKQD
uniref:Cytoskeleton-associated protein 2 C-terminal domain-containing protein n=1 Tax=Eptatretus burgeri TaxID=7764 RepID=A0A8C4QBA9_EPTBU